MQARHKQMPLQGVLTVVTSAVVRQLYPHLSEREQSKIMGRYRTEAMRMHGDDLSKAVNAMKKLLNQTRTQNV